jgi:hypothetical protein
MSNSAKLSLSEQVPAAVRVPTSPSTRPGTLVARREGFGDQSAILVTYATGTSTQAVSDAVATRLPRLGTT